jgi:outer membrane PBP1 activator LpoA protein
LLCHTAGRAVKGGCGIEDSALIYVNDFGKLCLNNWAFGVFVFAKVEKSMKRRLSTLDISRRVFALGALASPAVLSACAGLDGVLPSGGDKGTPAQTGPGPVGGDVIGNGPVKIAMILPLSSANGQAAAASLRNAAAMAMGDFGNSNLTILIKDDKGTPEGARAAAQEALSQGAELILGPLFAASVSAAAQVARGAGKNMIAFSSDAGVAQRGVYLLSFLPQSDVQRIVSFAGSKGKKSIAALLPQSAYGNVAEAELMQQGNGGGRRITAVQRYQSGNKATIDAAIEQLKGALAQSDTLFLAESAEGIGLVTQSLQAAGVLGKVQIISTGLWDQRAVHGTPGLEGAWFAAPDSARFNALAQRYSSQFGSAPTRIATLGYDAVTLANALTQNFGTQRFSEATLTNASGFSGQDGVFRFRLDGRNERGIAVYEIRSGGAQIISPSPGSF